LLAEKDQLSPTTHCLFDLTNLLDSALAWHFRKKEEC
jgi:hypothetical protein